MDIGYSSVSAQTAPIAVSDTRPSADVAASKHVREPALAFSATGMAPNTSQAASVSRSMLLATGVEEADKVRAVAAMEQAERTLKPYGTPMLPDRSHSEGADSADSDGGADGTIENEQA
ncbi:hypothetical protein [Flavimaricola marinus]|uniref:Uncharacterized protein n=1 Tax=Flavimaricola marinus TaxID=1819565 RepID=A0A238LKT8_9RHOB|nr:hypothetical protein [Flavimaricola marinus]SMY09566.1 hypothetical protein LOM8899_03733 [Flavimaricola marinus]